MFEEGELEEGTDEDYALYNELCAFENTDLTVEEVRKLEAEICATA